MSVFELTKFDPQPNPELVCSICYCILHQPRECRCRHVFCKVCIETWLVDHPTCPTCRNAVYMHHLKPVLPLVQNMLNSLTMFCDFREEGCQMKITMEHYDSHIKSCDFQTVRCSNAGCTLEFLKSAMANHEENCPYRSVMCEQGCGLRMQQRLTDTHSCMDALKECVKERDAKLSHYRAVVRWLRQKIDLMQQVPGRSRQQVRYFGDILNQITRWWPSNQELPSFRPVNIVSNYATGSSGNSGAGPLNLDDDFTYSLAQPSLLERLMDEASVSGARERDENRRVFGPRSASDERERGGVSERARGNRLRLPDGDVFTDHAWFSAYDPFDSDDDISTITDSDDSRNVTIAHSSQTSRSGDTVYDANNYDDNYEDYNDDVYDDSMRTESQNDDTDRDINVVDSNSASDLETEDGDDDYYEGNDADNSYYVSTQRRAERDNTDDRDGDDDSDVSYRPPFSRSRSNPVIISDSNDEDNATQNEPQVLSSDSEQAADDRDAHSVSASVQEHSPRNLRCEPQLSSREPEYSEGEAHSPEPSPHGERRYSSAVSQQDIEEHLSSSVSHNADNNSDDDVHTGISQSDNDSGSNGWDNNHVPDDATHSDTEFQSSFDILRSQIADLRSGTDDLCSHNSADNSHSDRSNGSDSSSHPDKNNTHISLSDNDADDVHSNKAVNNPESRGSDNSSSDSSMRNSFPYRPRRKAFHTVSLISDDEQLSRLSPQPDLSPDTHHTGEGADREKESPTGYLPRSATLTRSVSSEVTSAVEVLNDSRPVLSCSSSVQSAKDSGFVSSEGKSVDSDRDSDTLQQGIVKAGINSVVNPVQHADTGTVNIADGTMHKGVNDESSREKSGTETCHTAWETESNTTLLDYSPDYVSDDGVNPTGISAGDAQDDVTSEMNLANGIGHENKDSTEEPVPDNRHTGSQDAPPSTSASQDQYQNRSNNDDNNDDELDRPHMKGKRHTKGQSAYKGKGKALAKHKAQPTGGSDSDEAGSDVCRKRKHQPKPLDITSHSDSDAQQPIPKKRLSERAVNSIGEHGGKSSQSNAGQATVSNSRLEENGDDGSGDRKSSHKKKKKSKPEKSGALKKKRSDTGRGSTSQSQQPGGSRPDARSSGHSIEAAANPGPSVVRSRSAARAFVRSELLRTMRPLVQEALAFHRRGAEHRAAELRAARANSGPVVHERMTTYSPASPDPTVYSSALPPLPRYTLASPRYTPTSPRYTPTSPLYFPASPEPAVYSPTSPDFPMYTPRSPGTPSRSPPIIPLQRRSHPRIIDHREGDTHVSGRSRSPAPRTSLLRPGSPAGIARSPARRHSRRSRLQRSARSHNRTRSGDRTRSRVANSSQSGRHQERRSRRRNRTGGGMRFPMQASRGARVETGLVRIADIPVPPSTYQLLNMYAEDDDSDRTWSPTSSGSDSD